MNKNRLMIGVTAGLFGLTTGVYAAGNGAGIGSLAMHSFVNKNPTVIAGRTAVKSDFTQLQADAKAGNNIIPDLSKLTTDGIQLQKDKASLVAAIQNSTAVQADTAAFGSDKLKAQADVTQLHSDKAAKNTSAIFKDTFTLLTDRTHEMTDLLQLKTDVSMISLTPLR